MKIWLLKKNLYEKFSDLHLVNYDDAREQIEKILYPQRIIDQWSSPNVYTLTEGIKSDFPQFWGDVTVSVFSQEALDIVHDLILDKVEPLPFKHPEYNYYGIHVINILDAIDYQHAIVKEMKSGLRVGFKKYAFIPSKIIGQHIFRVSGYRPQSEVFVSDGFKERITSSSLVGYDFEEVWDSKTYS
jgi:hypothetical protein